MLIFDDKGYLRPYEPVVVDHETFVREFVINEFRAEIYSAYKRLLEHLADLSLGPFYQWIDESFVSQKARPRDIDVVTFIDYKKYEKNERMLRQMKKHNEKVDSYYVKDYPENHSRRFITEFDKTEWVHLFSTDRRRTPTGFIQLNFG